MPDPTCQPLLLATSRAGISHQPSQFCSAERVVCILTPASLPRLRGTLAHRPLPLFRLPVSCLVLIQRSVPRASACPRRRRPRTSSSSAAAPLPMSRLRRSLPIVALADLPQLELAAAGAWPEGRGSSEYAMESSRGAPPVRDSPPPVRDSPPPSLTTLIPVRYVYPCFNSASQAICSIPRLCLSVLQFIWNYLAT